MVLVSKGRLLLMHRPFWPNGIKDANYMSRCICRRGQNGTVWVQLDVPKEKLMNTNLQMLIMNQGLDNMALDRVVRLSWLRCSKG